MDFLDKLRRKPASTRRGIALGVAAAVVLILLTFWGLSFKERYLDNVSDNPVSEIDPFKTIGKNISEVFNSFKEGFGELNESLKEASSSELFEGTTTQNGVEIQGENAILETYEGEGVEP